MSDKKLSFSPKRFFCPSSYLLCLAIAQKIAHWLSRLGELHLLAGNVLILLARLAGALSLHVNKRLKVAPIATEKLCMPSHFQLKKKSWADLIQYLDNYPLDKWLEKPIGS